MFRSEYADVPAVTEPIHEAVLGRIGVYDEDGNEIPKAYAVRQRAAEDLTEDDIVAFVAFVAFVAERVAPYKKIRRVRFIGGVPRAASGKILRREPRARERENT